MDPACRRNESASMFWRSSWATGAALRHSKWLKGLELRQEIRLGRKRRKVTYAEL
jgi:hypothetical protein